MARIGADRTAQLVARVGGRRDRAAASWTRRPTSPGRRASRSGPRASTACWARTSSADEQRDAARPRRESRPSPPRPASPSRRAPPGAAGRRRRPGDGARRDRPDLAPRHRHRGRRRRGDRPRPRLRAGPVGHARHARCRAFRPSPLEVRELVRETLAGAGLTEVVTTALVSPRHLETFVLARDVPSVGDEAQPGGEPIGVDEPALARPLAAAPQPARQPARRRRARTCATGPRTSRCSRSARATPATGDEPREWWRLGFALRRRRRAAGLEPRRPPVRPRRCQGHPRAAGAPARPRPPGLRGRDRRGRVPPGPHGAGEIAGPPARARRRAPPATSWTPGSCGPTDRGHRRPRSRIEGLAAGRLAPGARAGRRPLPGGGARPRDRRARGDGRGRRRGGRSASTRGELLRDVRLFDIYRGVPLAAGREEPRVPAAVRGARPDAHRGRGRGGRRGDRGRRCPRSGAASAPDASDAHRARRAPDARR